ncbi:MULTISPECIES: hypothetical protein [unclassified Novosphingobium]|uniref:hypothetical protein n=1 Tax=unclassified Novosphingobium TaxID=2644732 RepID=UPI00135B3173|nr:MULTISPECIES: hypothetical protein [unclassified Novosphingobium]
MIRHATSALAGTALLSLLPATPAMAHERPDKLIALIGSRGCDMPALDSRLDVIGRQLADDRSTHRVSIDRPADPAANLDLMGKPSTFAGAIEVSAASSRLQDLSRRIASGLGQQCPVDIYLVRERRLLDTAETLQAGHPSSTVKVLVTLTRKQGTTSDALEREWGGPHAQLALAWRKERGGAGYYVQNVVVRTLGRDAPALDGIGESEGPGGSPPDAHEREGRIKTAAHAATFQDMSKAAMFVARETVLKRPPAP